MIAPTLKLTFMLLVCVALASTAWEDREWLRYYTLLTPKLLISNFLVVVSVAVGGWGLYRLNPTIFGFNWWRIVLWFSSLGEPDWRREETKRGERWKMGESFMVVPIEVKILGPIFFFLLLLCLPHWAYMEETWFRAGTAGWLGGLGRSIMFGLSHIVLGIPLALALTMSLNGLWLTHCYFIGGVEFSALNHFAYNLIVFGLAFLVSLILQFVPSEVIREMRDGGAGR